MTGLVALAPPVSATDSAKVLLRRVDKQIDMGGDRILPHHALVRFFTGPGPEGVQDRPLTKGETVDFTLPDGGGPRIDQPGAFLDIGGPGLDKGLPAKAVFRNGAGGSDVMSGRVVLSGGVISPIELTQILDLRQVSRQLTLELRGVKVLGGAATAVQAPRLVANGLLFERDLADGERPAIRIDGSDPVQLAPTAPADLGFLAGATGDVFVVWVVNTALPPDGKPTPAGERQPPRKSARPGEAQRRAAAATSAAPSPGADVGFDPDFDLLFDFVQATRGDRLIPMVFDPQAAPGDPPGACMPGRCRTASGGGRPPRHARGQAPGSAGAPAAADAATRSADSPRSCRHCPVHAKQPSASSHRERSH